MHEHQTMHRGDLMEYHVFYTRMQDYSDITCKYNAFRTLELASHNILESYPVLGSQKTIHYEQQLIGSLCMVRFDAKFHQRLEHS